MGGETADATGGRTDPVTPDFRRRTWAPLVITLVGAVALLAVAWGLFMTAGAIAFGIGYDPYTRREMGPHTIPEIWVRDPDRAERRKANRRTMVILNTMAWSLTGVAVLGVAIATAREIHLRRKARRLRRAAISLDGGRNLNPESKPT